MILYFPITFVFTYNFCMLTRISGVTTAVQVFAFFGYTGCPELFFCYACLFGPLVGRCLSICKRPAPSRSRRKGCAAGLHIRVNGVPFQTKSQFLKSNGYNNPELDVYKCVMGTSFKQADTIVIEGATHGSYTRSLPANWLNGMADVAKECVISSLAVGAGVPRTPDRVRAGKHMEMYRVSVLEAVASKKPRR